MTFDSIAIIGILGFAVSCSAWLLVAIFGFWVYRTTKFKNGLYLGIYWLLTCPLLRLANYGAVKLLVKTSSALSWLRNGLQAPNNPLRSTVTMQWMIWAQVLGAFAVFLVLLLLCADIATLLERAGHQPSARPLRYLLALRNFGFVPGQIAIGLVIVSQLLWLRLAAL